MSTGVVVGVLGVVNLVQLWLNYNLLNKLLIQAKVGPLLKEKEVTISDNPPAEKRGKLAFSVQVPE